MSIIGCTITRGGAPLLQMKLDLDQSRPNEKTVFDHLQAGSSFEPDVTSAFVRLLHAGDVAIDVGANCGFLTVLAAMLVGPTGHVVAFEPDDENLARLRGNLALNDCSNVTVIEKALAGSDAH